MKGPYEVITESVFKSLDQLKENQRYNFSNSEKFLLWIVGFSIGGISIIVTSLAQFSDSYSHIIIKIILTLLSISVICGIIYRWHIHLYFIQYQKVEFYLQGAFSNEKMMDIEADDISDEKDIKEVIRRLKNDFGEDASYVLEIYNNISEEKKAILLEDFKNHYTNISKNVKQQYKLTKDYVKETMTKAFGISEKKFDRLINQDTGKQLNKFGRIATIAFLISCFSFIIVLCCLCIFY